MVQDGIPFVAPPVDGRIRFCTQQKRVGTVDTSEAQLTHRLRDHTRITPYIGRERQGGMAAALTDALNPRCGVPIEDTAIFGEGDGARRLLERRPVCIRCATFHVVNRLTPEFDRRFRRGWGRRDPSAGGRDRLEVPGPNGRGAAPVRPRHAHAPPCRQGALEGAGRLRFDLRPRRARDRGKFPMEIIHILPLVSENQYRGSRRAWPVALGTCPPPQTLWRSGQQSMGPLALP